MRRGMGDQHAQARREAFDLRCPVGEQRGGRHQQARAAGRPSRRLSTSSRASTWMVLPSPMSSARQAPRPSREAGTASARRPAGRAAASPGERRPGRRRPNPPDCAAAPASRPATGRRLTCDHSGATSTSWHRRCADAGPGQQAHGLDEAQALLAGQALDLLEMRRGSAAAAPDRPRPTGRGSAPARRLSPAGPASRRRSAARHRA